MRISHLFPDSGKGPVFWKRRDFSDISGRAPMDETDSSNIAGDVEEAGQGVRSEQLRRHKGLY